MKMKLGLGLSFGAMVVAAMGIHAIVDCRKEKENSKVEIARIEAEAARNAKKTTTRKKTTNNNTNTKDKKK